MKFTKVIILLLIVGLATAKFNFIQNLKIEGEHEDRERFLNGFKYLWGVFARQLVQDREFTPPTQCFGTSAYYFLISNPDMADAYCYDLPQDSSQPCYILAVVEILLGLFYSTSSECLMPEIGDFIGNQCVKNGCSIPTIISRIESEYLVLLTLFMDIKGHWDHAIEYGTEFTDLKDVFIEAARVVQVIIGMDYSRP